MNKADSERLEGEFESLGLARSLAMETADVVVVNTCVVRQTAEDAATSLFGSLKKNREQYPNQTAAVMGCMVDADVKTLRRRFPYIDVWARPQEYGPVLETVTARLAHRGVQGDGCLSGALPASLGTSAFIPVVHGCDKFCTFCIIPYRRGRETSRTIEEIISEAEQMVERGVKEITLLGQNVDSYGHDLRPRKDFADILDAMNDVEGIERIRFLTSHPNDMSIRIIKAVRDLPKVCENVNLPFQAGSDAILTNMRRGYTRSQYLDKINEIRDLIPGVALVTDVIVGFPGEAGSDFDDTLDLLKEVRFDKVHGAAYSERPGAYAARRIMDDVPRSEKKSRLKILNELQENIQREIYASLKGASCKILIDSVKQGRPSGRTRGNKLTHMTSGTAQLGEVVELRIISTSPWSLEGVPITDAKPE